MGNLRQVSSRCLGTVCLLAALGALNVCAQDQPDNAPVLSGRWLATVGDARTMRGKWIGQTLPGQPNEAQGSWTLSNDSGKTVMTGTWSAKKTAGGWQGSWSAEDRAGKHVSGTWKADPNPHLKGTLQSMLELTSKQEIAGTWRSGGVRGDWWLKGK